VVVAPKPPQWNGWGDWRPGANHSAPRIRVWVDRGEWSTYRPGELLWVYFRVDRPCYVTILDYAPDGRVDTIYPSRWSGSSFVSPGVTYRVPESRGYSLRIAGPGGIETLVACAHGTPWPSGPAGVWIPRHRPDRGRVVVGRPGGSPPPGWSGRVDIFPHGWPVPPAWRDHPEIWSCDAVSFYVEVGGPWQGGPWNEAPPSYEGWQGGSWGQPPYGNGTEWPDGSYRNAPEVFSDHFRMGGYNDHYYRDLHIAGEKTVISIECIESTSGQPTEIVGRFTGEDRRGDDVLFRLDVDGKHGDRPHVGQVFHGENGGLAADVRVADLSMDETKSWQEPRLSYIDFDVRVYAR
jgi:hypothetical protein